MYIVKAYASKERNNIYLTNVFQPTSEHVAYNP